MIVSTGVDLVVVGSGTRPRSMIPVYLSRIVLAVVISGWPGFLVVRLGVRDGLTLMRYGGDPTLGMLSPLH